MPKIVIDDVRRTAIDQSSTASLSSTTADPSRISERFTATIFFLSQVSATPQLSFPTAITIASFSTTITIEPFATSVSETETSIKATSSTTVVNTPSFATSTTTFPSPTRPPDPTQSSGTAVTSLGKGPIIGLVIGGIIVVALSALTAVMLIKRCRRKRYAPVPTVNPLLDVPLLKELASQRDLSEKGRPFYLHENSSAGSSSSQIQTQSQTQHQKQDQNQSTLGDGSLEPALPQKLKDFEVAMQRQMKMMERMSQRINSMVLELEAQQHVHRDMYSEPPKYENQPSK